ncbi:hypothetical protein [Actinophytocola gossypii]|uniref:Uncharacterized protein n=1 Tax=Actinophytocola gossypii TaxID=2812003 RepID=A0ABT2JB00_9PSEU|nr:hypothetical protein [Actinophytocola gossypii]MCT2584469.1 hypothetical protein [Actinophytocola gossypii]
MAMYRKLDDEIADNLLAAGRNRLDTLTAHLSNLGPHAAEQAAQPGWRAEGRQRDRHR